MTIQHGDIILIDGISYTTHSRILETCPQDHPLIRRIALTQAMENGWDCNTAMARGYLARWIISNSILFLEAVDGIYRLNSDFPIIADWYTGFIELGGGNSLDLSCPVTGVLNVNAGNVTTIHDHL